MKKLLAKIIFTTQVALLLGAAHSMQAQALEFGETLKDSSYLLQKMEEPSSMAASSDDQNLYVSNFTDNSLLVFKREALSGKLILIQTLLNNANGITGLGGANFATVSPDGKTVYVASLSDHSVSAFGRNAADGKLTFLAVYKDGVAGVDGLRLAQMVKVSPDNKNVYVSGTGDNAVAVFSRDEATGLLTFTEYKKNGVNGVSGIVQPYVLTVSGDGNHVYVSSSANSLAVFERDPVSGALTFLEAYYDNMNGVNGLDGITSVFITENGKFLYVTAENDNSVTVFSRDVTSGLLTFVQLRDNTMPSLSTFLTPSFVTASSDGSLLYVGTYNNAETYVFQCNTTTGTMLFKGKFQDVISGTTSSLVVSSQQDFLYRADITAKVISLYHTTGSAGFYTWSASYENNQQVEVVDGLDGANFTTLTADGKHLYVAAYNDNSVTFFNRNTDGTLRYVQAYKDDLDADGLSGCSFVALSPDEKFVYGIGTSDHGLALFSRNEVSGALSYLSTYVNNSDGITGMISPSAIAFSSDGKSAYVTALTAGGAVIVFDRDPSTGLLTYVETQKNGVNGVTGLTLRTASHIKVSNDGKFVYTASIGDNAIDLFSRDAVTGKLTYITAYQDGVNNIDGLGNVSFLAFSEDEKFLYATAFGDNAISLFERNETTGILTLLSSYWNSMEGLEEMTEPSSLTIHPSGKYLFVTSSGNKPIQVFIRNSATGKLAFYKSYSVDNLTTAPAFITVSNDGNFLYITAPDDKTITMNTIINLPDAPTGFEATAVDGLIELNWDIQTSPGPTISHYTIYRSTENNPLTASVIGTSSSSSFEDITMDVNVKYYYWLTSSDAINGYESYYSVVDSAMIDYTTGIKSSNIKESSKAYPNPSSGIVYIPLSGDSFSQIEICNSNHQVLQSLSSVSFQTENKIDLSSLPAGIYVIKFVGENSVKTVRVVKY